MSNRKQAQLHNRGAALLIFVIFFLIASTILVVGIGHRVYEDLTAYRSLEFGKRSFYVAEAGLEDAIYRHRDGRNYSNTETIAFGGATTTIVRTLIVDSYRFVAEGNTRNTVRNGEAWLTIGDGAAFNFGLQAGNGGIRMFNSSSVKGNVFANGPVQGSGNMVYGDAISAGATGLVDNIHATGSVWSHTINNAVVDKNAYYVTKTGTIVSGTSYPGSPDQATATMPIPDSMIADWKTDITTTGTVIASTSAQCSGGQYEIDSSITLNNVKIDCNVEISKNSTVVTLAGPVWVAGNLTFVNGPTLSASSSLGTKSVQIIVDKVTNRTTSSKITIQNSTNFVSGNALSYVVLISMNNSAELGGPEYGIELANLGVGKVLLFAPHGLVNLQNNVSLKEVTGYRIALYNSAQVIYESGLMNLLFTSGPGGGFTITRWEEVE